MQPWHLAQQRIIDLHRPSLAFIGLPCANSLKFDCLTLTPEFTVDSIDKLSRAARPF
jgi:hypothetical protein